MLVIGGSFHVSNGNRALEDAVELVPVSLERIRLFTQQVKVAKDLFDLRDAVSRLAEDDINIVGSRGYVYSSKLLARLIPSDGLRWEPNLLPRTVGLRAKYLELAGFNHV
jgi:hypothetical protein